MSPSLLIAALLASARAGVLVELPADAETVGLLVCDPAPCSRADMVGLPTDVPIVIADAVLDTETALDRLQRFEATLTEAREGLVAGTPEVARFAVERAERSLAVLDTVPTQALFDLYYLRGAALVAAGRDGADGAFRQAAASAWNRDVDLPTADPAARRAYDAAALGLLAQGSASLSFASAPAGATWTLDGVDLGEHATRVRVLPGAHRLTATTPDGRAWTDTIRLSAGGHAEVEAVLSPAGDAWVPDSISEAVLSGQVSHDLASWLHAWMTAEDVREVRLVRVSPVGAVKQLVITGPPPR